MVARLLTFSDRGHTAGMEAFYVQEPIMLAEGVSLKHMILFHADYYSHRCDCSLKSCHCADE